jgi:flagellin-specific chaperone FliS
MKITLNQHQIEHLKRKLVSEQEDDIFSKTLKDGDYEDIEQLNDNVKSNYRILYNLITNLSLSKIMVNIENFEKVINDFEKKFKNLESKVDVYAEKIDTEMEIHHHSSYHEFHHDYARISSIVGKLEDLFFYKINPLFVVSKNLIEGARAIKK